MRLHTWFIVSNPRICNGIPYRLETRFAPPLCSLLTAHPEGRRGVQWSMLAFLKHPDYTDSICLFSHQVTDPAKWLSIWRRRQAGWDWGGIQTKSRSLGVVVAIPLYPFICFNWWNIEGINQLVCVHLVGVVSTRGGAKLNVAWRINSTKSTSAIVSEIWKWKYLNIKFRQFHAIKPRNNDQNEEANEGNLWVLCSRREREKKSQWLT